MSEKRRFLATMLSIIAIGAAAVAVPPLLGWHIPVLEAFAEALIVAGVLGLTVDPYLKSKLFGETFDQLLHSIFGRRLPPELQQQIRRIANSTFVRRNLEINVVLQRVEENFDVTFAWQFAVTNLAETSQTFTHLITGDLGPLPTPPRLLGASASIADGGYDLNESDLAWTSPGQDPKWERTVVIPAGATASFSSTVGEAYPEHWVYTMQASEVTIGARIRVVAPAEVEIDVYGGDATVLPVRTGAVHTFSLPNKLLMPGSLLAVEWRQGRTANGGLTSR